VVSDATSFPEERNDMTLRSHLVSSAICAASIVGVVGSAEATLVSFASDDDSSALTLAGNAGSGGSFVIRNGRTPSPTPVTLNIDDDNGVQPTAHLPVGLVVELTANYVSSSAVGSGWLHLYSVQGSYKFVNPASGADLLTVLVDAGSSAMTIVGSPTTWGSAGSISGGDGLSSGITYAANPGLLTYASSLGMNILNYGSFLVGTVEDFAFTMTNTNAGGGSVGLNAGHLPTTAWGSEASHSGHVVWVPAPGTGAGAMVAGLIMFRRRRRL